MGQIELWAQKLIGANNVQGQKYEINKGAGYLDALAGHHDGVFHGHLDGWWRQNFPEN